MTRNQSGGITRKWKLQEDGRILRNALLGMGVFLAALFLAPLLAGAAGTPAGTSISNQATATYQDAVSNNFSQVSNTTTVTVTSVYAVAITAPADNNAYINTTVYYPYTLTNSGNDNNTFALSGASAHGWTVTLYVDTNGNGIHEAGETTTTSSTGVLAPDATYRFFMAVTVPNDNSIASGTTDVATLTVNGANGGTNDDATDQVTTTIVRPTLGVVKEVRLYPAGTFAATANAAPDNVVEYRVTVTNSGLDNAASVVLSDPIDVNTGYEIGSAAFTAGTSGLTGATAAFSNTARPGPYTYGYTPVSTGCGAPAGYDYCVTSVRWTATGSMGTGGANFNVIFRVRVK